MRFAATRFANAASHQSRKIASRELKRQRMTKPHHIHKVIWIWMHRGCWTKTLTRNWKTGLIVEPFEPLMSQVLKHPVGQRGLESEAVTESQMEETRRRSTWRPVTSKSRRSGSMLEHVKQIFSSTRRGSPCCRISGSQPFQTTQ